ncbi:MAG TPA: carbamate kinase [Thermodesulfobacteriota bacterium]|nr:carbamate kinase [Thermodesulfobacteriota bacterium]
MPSETKKTIIVSLGGNCIIRRRETGTIKEQFENTRKACSFIAKTVSAGKNVIITHGNGPVVGNILIRQEAAKDAVPPMPLYICDADSEGGIGFMIQQTLYNELLKTKKIRDVVTVVTQIVVDKKDSAFSNPAKPVGPYYTKEEAEALSRKKGWFMKEDSLRGFRRFVASPRPLKVIEAGIIKKLSESGVIVIAAGGGGIPVVENPDGTLHGVDAVIDKDLATSTLAREIGAEEFINLTQIEMVYLDFGKPAQRGIPRMDVREAKKYLKRGEFLAGSMRPKVEAAIEFLEDGGKEVIITTPELIEDAMEGKAGTRVYL